MRAIDLIRLALSVSAVVASTVGCDSTSKLKREDLLGTYLYVGTDPGYPQHDWDRLDLRADGNYALIKNGDATIVKTEEDRWDFRNGNRAELLLRDRVFPVRNSGGKLRFLINDDLGQWYEKVM